MNNTHQKFRDNFENISVWICAGNSIECFLDDNLLCDLSDNLIEHYGNYIQVCLNSILLQAAQKEIVDEQHTPEA